MNERFEDLMYKAGLTAQGCWDKMDSYDKQAIEKFAQLIIEECANVADENYIHRGSRTCGLAIRLHFGVDE